MNDVVKNSVIEGKSGSDWNVTVYEENKKPLIRQFSNEAEAKAFAASERRRLGIRQ
ncbi:hypothetical protein [Rhizobium leguminosarum]|uniref:hypothetical protein n=1 Tax=Rhizobium leguminosarum TaxID=384 RepID=UPI003F9CB6A8